MRYTDDIPDLLNRRMAFDSQFDFFPAGLHVSEVRHVYVRLYCDSPDRGHACLEKHDVTTSSIKFLSSSNPWKMNFVFSSQPSRDWFTEGALYSRLWDWRAEMIASQTIKRGWDNSLLLMFSAGCDTAQEQLAKNQHGHRYYRWNYWNIAGSIDDQACGDTEME